MGAAGPLCPVCGRDQHWLIGRLGGLANAITITVAVLAAVVASYQAYQAERDSGRATEARDLAVEASREAVESRRIAEEAVESARRAQATATEAIEVADSSAAVAANTRKLAQSSSSRKSSADLAAERALNESVLHSFATLFFLRREIQSLCLPPPTENESLGLHPCEDNWIDLEKQFDSLASGFRRFAVVDEEKNYPEAMCSVARWAVRTPETRIGSKFFPNTKPPSQLYSLYLAESCEGVNSTRYDDESELPDFLPADLRARYQ